MSRLPRSEAAVARAPIAHSRTRLVFATVLFSLLMAISAHLSFPLPGTPVPFTLQPFVLLLAAGFLGGVGAASAMIAYLAMGLAGLPVFAGGGGFGYLFLPSGGFLIGFAPAAFVAGALAARRRSPFAIAAAFAAGIVVLFAYGTAHLSLFFGKDLATTLRAAVYPFLLGDLVKVAIAAAVVAAWRARESR